MKKSFHVRTVAFLLASTLTLPLAAKHVPDSPDQSQNQSAPPSPQPNSVPQTPAAVKSATQSEDDANKSAREAVDESAKGNGGRVLGVLPNFRTTNEKDVYKPLRAKDKWLIAYHDSFDYTVFVLAAGFAGWHQLQNDHRQFGQGVEGYAKYYGTAYLDQSVGNIMTEGLFPSLLHQDPRYFRKGTGSISSRLGFAMKQIFVTRTDSGNYTFNMSEWGGNAVATAFQNFYYSNSRNAESNTVNWFVAVGTDMASDILKEFWPDVKKKVFHKAID